MNAPRHPERGLTLTEVMIVVVLAAVVMTGMIIFYLNAQATWIDGSTQAITQREATLVVRELTARTRAAASAAVSGSPNATVNLSMGAGTLRTWRFWWEPSDSLVHESYIDSLGVEHPLGAILTSRVECFAVHKDDYMVYLDSLRVLTPQGTRVTVSGSAAMINRGAP